VSEQGERRRIGFVVPMRVEMRPLVKTLSLRRSRLGDLRAYSGMLGAQNVLAVATGIGTQAATDATEQLLRLTGVDHVVVVGVAGGVEPDIRIGDVVVPEVVVMASTGTEYRPAPLGEVTLRGRLLTTAVLATGPEVLARLREQQVTAVDMETASVAAVCQRKGVPWTAFRAISDRLVDNIVDDSFTGLANADGTPRVGPMLRYVIKRPARIRGMVKLSRDISVATAAAARTAIAACRAEIR
jgi:adenosylhomocysteine nucleosidase